MEELEHYHEKVSQKRKDRQKRRQERRILREKRQEFDEKQEHKKPVRARLSKKSLPGFLAKNADVIKRWLMDYETLYSLADDYGIQRLDRLPKEKLDRISQEYIDISNFITILGEIQQEEKQKCKETDSEIRTIFEFHT